MFSNLKQVSAVKSWLSALSKHILNEMVSADKELKDLLTLKVVALIIQFQTDTTLTSWIRYKFFDCVVLTIPVIENKKVHV